MSDFNKKQTKCFTALLAVVGMVGMTYLPVVEASNNSVFSAQGVPGLVLVSAVSGKASGRRLAEGEECDQASGKCDPSTTTDSTTPSADNTSEGSGLQGDDGLGATEDGSAVEPGSVTTGDVDANASTDEGSMDEHSAEDY